MPTQTVDVTASFEVEQPGGALSPLKLADLQRSDPAAGPGALDASVLGVKSSVDALRTELGTPIAVTGTVDVGNLPATQPVSAVALPLPTGAATAARQDTQAGKLDTLAAIDYATEGTLQVVSGKLGTPAADDMLSLLRSIAANTLLETTKTDVLQLTADQVNLNTDQVEAKLDTVSGRIGTTGVPGSAVERIEAVRAAIAGTPAVSVSNWPATQPVSAAALPLPAGAATEATLAAVDTKLAGVLAVDTGLSAAGALATEATQAAIDTKLGDPLAVSQSGAWSLAVTNGAQAADTIASDAGQNALLAAGSRKESTFSVTAAGSPVSVDCSAYRNVSVQITSQGTGSTVNFEVSNDNATWVACTLQPSTQSGTSNAVGAASSVGVWSGAVKGRFFRVRVAGITAGTTAGVVEFFSVPETPVLNTGGSIGPPSDALAQANSLYTNSFSLAYNGATWDRARVAGDSIANTGVLASGTQLWDSSGSVWKRARSINNLGDAHAGDAHLGIGAYAYNGTAWDRIRTAPAVTGTPGTGLLGVGLMVKGTTNYNPASASVAAADGDLGIGALAVHGGTFNGTTFDRLRGNVDGTALASAARTATTSSADITNYNGDGALIILRVSAITTAPSLTVAVEGKDPASGLYFALNATPTAVTAVGTYVYEIGEGASSAAAGGITQRTAGQLPRTFRVTVTHGNANSVTYSVGYTIITA